MNIRKGQQACVSVFEDIITKEDCDYIKSCLNCAYYYESVKLPGDTRTREICSARGMIFNGEITCDCDQWRNKNV